MGSGAFDGGTFTGAEEPGGVVCPRFHHAIELLGRRWSGAIVYSLFEGPLYFRQIAAAVPGVSDRLLAERLRELESEGVVERSVHNGPPTRVSYALTDAGRELEPMLRSLCEWARERLPKDAVPSGGSSPAGDGRGDGEPGSRDTGRRAAPPSAGSPPRG